MNVGGLDLELVVRASGAELSLGKVTTQLQMKAGVRAIGFDDQSVTVDVIAPTLRGDVGKLLRTALEDFDGVGVTADELEAAQSEPIAHAVVDDALDDALDDAVARAIWLEAKFRMKGEGSFDAEWEGVTAGRAYYVRAAQDALAPLFDKLVGRRDPLTPPQAIECALLAIGQHDEYTIAEIGRIVDMLSSRFTDGDGAQFALQLRNTANAVHPLRITRASVELVARELSRVNQLEVETPSKWDELSDGARHSWLVTAERLLAQL